MWSFKGIPIILPLVEKTRSIRRISVVFCSQEDKYSGLCRYLRTNPSIPCSAFLRISRQLIEGTCENVHRTTLAPYYMTKFYISPNSKHTKIDKWLSN